MKTKNLLTAAAIVLIGLAAWLVWPGREPHQDTSHHDESDPRPAKEPLSPRLSSSRAANASRATADEGKDEARLAVRSTSWSAFQRFLTSDHENDSGSDTMDILEGMPAWTQSQCRDACRQLLTARLQDEARTGLFTKLLYCLSDNDSEGALALYDEAQRTSGFNQDGRFFIHRLVMAQADRDPLKAEDWLLSHQDQLPKGLAQIMLEKVREKAE